MNVREILKAVPSSYDDFIDFTAGWMEKDDQIRDAILKLLQDRPESNSGDVLEVLSNYLGIGSQPLEIVDDEDSHLGSAASGMMSAAF